MYFPILNWGAYRLEPRNLPTSRGNIRLCQWGNLISQLFPRRKYRRTSIHWAVLFQTDEWKRWQRSIKGAAKWATGIFRSKKIELSWFSFMSFSWVIRGGLGIFRFSCVNWGLEIHGFGSWKQLLVGPGCACWGDIILIGLEIYDIICMFCVSETPGDAVFFVLQMVYLNNL